MAEPVQMLHRELDVEALRQEFQRRDRLRIPQFLAPEYAEQAARWLETRIPWKVAFRRGAKAATMSEQEFRSATPAQQEQLLREITKQAAEDFQYLYGHYNLADAYQELREPDAFLFRLIEFLSGEECLQFARSVSGEEGIERITVQATRYVPGQFLTRHDDAEDPQRLVAYVLGLTRKWEPEWGGLLQVTDTEGNVVESYTPRFNSMVMFRVPLMHCVSFVAPFAQAPRHSITGWFTT